MLQFPKRVLFLTALKRRKKSPVIYTTFFNFILHIRDFLLFLKPRGENFASNFPDFAKVSKLKAVRKKLLLLLVKLDFRSNRRRKKSLKLLSVLAQFTREYVSSYFAKANHMGTATLHLR